MIASLVRDKLGYKYHWAVADYLQRAARHIASKTDVAQAYAVGKAAVELALKGHNSVMAAIVRKSDKPYRWSIDAVSLRDVANRERMMPRNFISADGFGITRIELSTVAEIPGISEKDFLQIAEQPKNGCPVSKALAGVQIELTAQLA